MTATQQIHRSRRPLVGNRNQISVSLGDRTDDVDDALRVVHEGFVGAGFMAPRRSGRRLHPSYLNPGTHFVVARIDGTPVGTVAMVNDGPFGLPCERAYAEEVDMLRDHGPVREVGSLVVDARFRRHTRHIFMHMLATIVRIVLDTDPQTSIVQAMAPEARRFTCSLFGCDVIGDERPLFGAPAVLLRTDRERLRASLDGSQNSSRRELRRLALDETATWLEVRYQEEPWPSEWLEPILAEEGTRDRLRAQMALLPQAASSVRAVA